jgi:hypothetical protein
MLSSFLSLTYGLLADSCNCALVTGWNCHDRALALRFRRKIHLLRLHLGRPPLHGFPEVSIYKSEVGLTVKTQDVSLGAVGNALEIISRDFIRRVV